MAMWLNGAFIGATTFGAVALASAYSSLKINGESKWGFVHVSNYEKTNAELDAIDRESIPDWLSTTLLLSTFDDENTGGGNVTGISSVDWFNIFRRKDTEVNFTKLATVEGDAEEYTDYTVGAGNTYKYQIYPASSTVLSNALETEFAEADFYGWYLIDEDTDKVYRFSFEVATGGITNTTDSKFVITQSKYPTHVMNGNTDFESGKITALYGTFGADGVTLEQEVETLEDLKTFINNGKSKILKSRKGHVWRVRTDNFSINNFSSEGIRQQPYLMSFNWRETAEVI